MTRSNSSDTPATSLRASILAQLQETLHLQVIATLCGVVPALVFIRYLSTSVWVRVPLTIVALFYFPAILFMTCLLLSLCMFVLRRFQAVERVLNGLVHTVSSQIQGLKTVKPEEVEQRFRADANGMLSEFSGRGVVKWACRMVLGVAFKGLQSVVGSRLNSIQTGKGGSVPADTVLQLLGTGIVKTALEPVKKSIQFYICVSVGGGLALIGAPILGVRTLSSR